MLEKREKFVFVCETTRFEPYCYDKRLGYLFTPRQAILYCEFYKIECKMKFICDGSEEGIEQAHKMNDKYKEYLTE